MPVPHGRVPLGYTPGGWVALAATIDPDSTNDVVAFLELDSAHPVAIGCWNALEQGAGLDALLGVILREGLRNVPGFALAARTPDSVRVLVSGHARAVVHGPHGTVELRGDAAADDSSWVERTVPGAAAVTLASPEANSGGSLPLLGGVVLASGVTLGVAGAIEAGDAAEPEVAERTTDEELPLAPQTISHDTIEPPFLQHPPALPTPERERPAADPGDIAALPFRVPGSFTSGPQMDVADAQTVAAPPVTEDDARTGSDGPSGPTGPDAAATGPTVLAVSCPNGHPGPPYSDTCRVCGAPIAPQEPHDVVRPSLGILNMSTGDMVPLDRDVVLGRSPSSDEADPQLRPHLVQLASPGNDISRNHVRVSLEGWHVLVTDLDSTNGTVVTVPDQQPVRLRAHDPFTVVPGTLITIADEVNVRYEVPS